MIINRKKEGAVLWMEPSVYFTQKIREQVYQALTGGMGALLAVAAAMNMLTEQWTEVRPDAGKLLLLLMELLVLTLIFTLLLPMIQLPCLNKGVRAVVVSVGGFLVALLVKKAYWKAPLEMEDGFLYLGNCFLDRYNMAHGTTCRLDNGMAVWAPWALTVLLAVVIWLFLNLTYLTRRWIFWSLLPLSVLGMELACCISPAWKSMVYFCISFWLLKEAEGFQERERKRVIMLQGKGQLARGNFHRGNTTQRYSSQGNISLGTGLCRNLLVMVLMAAGMAGIYFMAGGMAGYLAQESRAAFLVRSLLEPQDGEQALDGNGLFVREVEVSNQAPVYKDSRVLEITLDGQPEESLYLKDFQGMVYQKGKWICKDSSFRSSCIRDGMEERRLQQLLLDALWNALQSEKREEQSVRGVLQFREWRSCFSIPYFCNMVNIPERLLTGDASIRRNLLQKKMEVQIPAEEVLSLEKMRMLLDEPGAGELEEAERELWDWYEEYVKKKYLEVPEGLPAVERMAETLKAEMKARSGPKNTGGSGHDIKTEETWTNQGRLDAAEKAAALLRSYTYSMELEHSGAEKDPVEEFLSVSGKGYCVHFASAGVLILRKMGIPARYAEGWLVPRDSFTEKKKGQYHAEVLDRNRHAWVEIWLEQVGWVPVEMTPGSGGNAASLPVPEGLGGNAGAEKTEPSGQQNEQMQEEENGEPGMTDSEIMDSEIMDSEIMDSEILNSETGELEMNHPGTGNPDKENPDKENQTKEDLDQNASDKDISNKGDWGNTAILAGGVAVIIFLGRTGVRVYLNVIEEEFRRGKYRRVILLISRRILRALKLRGKVRGWAPADEVWLQEAKNTWNAVTAEEWDRFFIYVQKAAFSAEIPDRKEAYFCRKIYRKISLSDRSGMGKRSIKQNTGWGKGLATGKSRKRAEQ